MVATIFAFAVAAFARPPLNKVSLAFGVGCVVPLAYKLFAHPGRLFGYVVLPPDFSYFRRDLADILTIWLAGFIAAAVAHYAPGRTSLDSLSAARAQTYGLNRAFANLRDASRRASPALTPSQCLT